MPDKDKPEEIWHHFYRLSFQGVVLQSNDGVLFQVSMSDLTRDSTVFQSILGLNQPTAGPILPIDIELNASVLEQLLDLLRCSEPDLRFDDDEDPIEDLFDMLGVCTLFEIRSIYDILVNKITNNFGHTPIKLYWRKLELAASGGHVDLFRNLLKSLDTKLINGKGRFWDYMARIHIDWRRPILMALFGDPDFKRPSLRSPKSVTNIAEFKVERLPHRYSARVGGESWIDTFEPYLHPILAACGTAKDADSDMIAQKDNLVCDATPEAWIDNESEPTDDLDVEWLVEVDPSLYSSETYQGSSSSSGHATTATSSQARSGPLRREVRQRRLRSASLGHLQPIAPMSTRGATSMDGSQKNHPYLSPVTALGRRLVPSDATITTRLTHRLVTSHGSADAIAVRGPSSVPSKRRMGSMDAGLYGRSKHLGISKRA